MATVAAVAVVAVASAVLKVSAADSAETLASPDCFVASYAGRKVSFSHFAERYCVDDPTASGSVAAKSDVGTVVVDWMALTADSADPSASDSVATSFPEFVAAECRHSRTTTAEFEVPLRYQFPSSYDSAVLVIPAVASE